MTINVEKLKIAIDIVDGFTAPLQRLSAQLAQISAQAKSVEDIDIGVNVHGDEAALGKLAALNAADMGNVGEAVTSGGATGAVGGGSRSDILRTMSKGRDEDKGVLESFNLRMSSIHNLLASLIPMLSVFVGAMPAAIAGLSTLATAALGAASAITAIGGLAFLGLADSRGGGDIMAGFKDILEELKDSFLEALLPLSKSFTPLARDALAGLENLFNAIAARGQTLKNLEDMARGFGQFVLDFVPSLLQTLGQLADAFSGVFAMAGEWLQTTDIIGGFVSVTQKAFPALMSLADSLITILPALVEMSVGFLRVADAILVVFRWFTQLLGVFSPLLDFIGLTATNVGMLVGSFLTLATVLALASKLQAFYAGTLGGKFVASVYSAIGAINAKVASLLGLQAATWGAYAATAALLGVLTFGLAPVLGSIASGWFGVSDGIKDATKSMERFNDIQGQSGIGGFGAGAQTGPVGQGAKTSVTNNNTDVTFVGEQSKDDQWRAANKVAYINRTQSPTR